jgi:hypothetical protein
MPWGGRSTISITTREETQATIKLRVPGWARNTPVPGGLYRYLDRGESRVAVSINGTHGNAAPDRFGYVSIARRWSAGDVIAVEVPLEARRVVADDRVVETRRRVSVERGPIVYCAEWPDAQRTHVSDLVLEPTAPLTATAAPAFFGGVTVIDTQARRHNAPSSAASPLRLIPYYLWANRGAGEMSVWVSSAPYAIGDAGPAGGIIFFDNPKYAVDGWRYLEAAPFDQSAGAKWGCFRRAIAGARGTAVGTGKQNTAEMLAACADRGTAADLCAGLSVNGVGGWFLPSRDELALLYRNLGAAGLGGLRDAGSRDNVSYWASTQLTADMAAHIDFADAGRQHFDDKDFPRRVRAIRSF